MCEPHTCMPSKRVNKGRRRLFACLASRVSLRRIQSSPLLRFSESRVLALNSVLSSGPEVCVCPGTSTVQKTFRKSRLRKVDPNVEGPAVLGYLDRTRIPKSCHQSNTVHCLPVQNNTIRSQKYTKQMGESGGRSQPWQRRARLTAEGAAGR